MHVFDKLYASRINMNIQRLIIQDHIVTKLTLCLAITPCTIVQTVV